MPRLPIGYVLIAVCALPAIVHGQRGRSAGLPTGGRGGINTQRGPAVEIPKYVHPVNLLIQHRQDLSLSDSQFTRVIAVKRSVDSLNAPLMRRLDSVQVLFKGPGPLFGSPSAERRDSLAAARMVVRETLENVKDNLTVARDEAYHLLSAQQLTKAQDFELKALRALEEEEQANARGRGDGRAAGRPPEG